MPLVVFATTVVGLRQKDVFVLGADSKATYRGKGINGPRTVCKVYRAGRVYFSISGLANDRNTNFFPEKIVANSFSDKAASFNSNLQRTERALSDSLAIEMTRLKARDRETFDQTQKDEGDTVAVLAAEMEGDHSVMGGAGFRYVDGTAPSIVIHRSICPRDCPRDEDVFYGGRHESAQKMATEFYKNHRTVTRPTKFARNRNVIPCPLGLPRDDADRGQGKPYRKKQLLPITGNSESICESEPRSGAIPL